MKPVNPYINQNKAQQKIHNVWQQCEDTYKKWLFEPCSEHKNFADISRYRCAACMRELEI